MGSEFLQYMESRMNTATPTRPISRRYGDLTLENAVLKIILDPQGYTAGLVSCFTPNVGMAPEEESSITAKEAEQIVRNR
ncbi:MAG: hypothetical protein ACLTER_16730 [Ruminococcus sp.]